MFFLSFALINQIKKLITTVNQTINTFENISGFLGNVTQWLQGGCLGAGAALVAKNFLLGLGGEGIARQTIMRGNDGWTERCADLVADKIYTSQDQCYLANAGKIDKDVGEVSKIISEQNKRIKQIESGITTQPFLSEPVVNTSAFIERYSEQVRTCLGSKSFVDPNGREGAIGSADFEMISYQIWKDKKIFTKEQLKDIELYCDIIQSSTADATLKQTANERIYSTLFDIKTNMGNFAEITDLAGRLQVASEEVTFIETGQNVKRFSYRGLTNGNRISGINANAPIAIVMTSAGKKYIMLW